jgi:hypothetical protein
MGWAILIPLKQDLMSLFPAFFSLQYKNQAIRCYVFTETHYGNISSVVCLTFLL